MSLRQPLRCGLSILICSCLFAGASQCRARAPQDVAEAARQERAHKDSQRRTKHVYTDEDLRRAKILTPDDEARVEARRQTQPAPAEEQAQEPASGDEIAQLPLGDIARRYRNAKLAAQMPDVFHLPFDEPVFADPVISMPVVAAPRSFSSAHPNPTQHRTDSVSAPAISSPAASQGVDPLMALPTPARPSGSFSPTHPNLMAAHPGAAVAPPLAGKAPSPSLDLSISAAQPARPATSFLPTHPNLAPTQPGGVIAPAMSNPAPLRRVDPFARRFAPPVPASAPTVRPPKVGAAIAPSVGESNLSRAMAPAASMANAAPVIAPQASLVRPSLLEHVVTVQAGDSLWKIAQQNLGRGSRWQELLAVNPSIVDPTRLAAGVQIVVPAETSTLKHDETDAKVVVRMGDTLTKIAQSQYGNAAAWSCIAEANPEIVDPNRIYEGQQLLLPFNCKR